MSREINERQNAHRLWAVRILTGLFLFWAGILWAELPGCQGRERIEELAWSQGQERKEELDRRSWKEAIRSSKARHSQA